MVSNQNFRRIEIGGQEINIFNREYLLKNDIDTSNPNSIFNVAIEYVERVYGELNNKIEASPIAGRKDLIDILKPISKLNPFDGKGIELRSRSLMMLISPYADLDGANLYRAHLDGANLDGAGLGGANLGEAGLDGARLNGAHLNRAYLNCADLKGANLEGAYLNRAYLILADLDGADLNGADLIGADLDGADLNGADLGGANLSLANLINVKGLTKEQLSEARYKKDFPPVAFNNCPNRNLIKHMQTYD